MGSVHTINEAPCEFSFVSVERKLNSKIFKMDVTFLFVRDRLCVFGQTKVTSKEAHARPDGEFFLLAVIAPRFPMQLILDRTRIIFDLVNRIKSLDIDPYFWCFGHPAANFQSQN